MLIQPTVNALIIRSLPVVRPDTDTTARFIAGQVGTALGESFDKDWLYVDAPRGDGWVARKFVAEVAAPAPVAHEKWPTVPDGRKAISALFGLPCTPDCERGRVTLPASLPESWEPTVRITRFACHVLLVPVFTSVFLEIHRRGYWELLEDFGGCYTCREQRGTVRKTSTHSWGIGVDLNAKSNPLGKTPFMPKPIIGIFSDHGFVWGGTWRRPDGMHFQYATGY